MLLVVLALSLMALPIPAQETVEIGWLSHTFEPWNVALSAQADQYMTDNSNVEVVYSHVPHADLNVRITTSIAGGDPPTIMGVFGPWMPQLLEAGALAPAPDWVVEDIETNFPAVMKDAATYDDEVYGYVQHIGIVQPIINVTLFEEFGLEPPTTYEELIAVDEAMSSDDFYGVTFAELRDGSWNVLQWSGILMAHGGSLLNEDQTVAAFNTEAGMKATEIYGSMVHPEIFHEDAFIIEQSAVYFNGPWQKGNLEASAPDIEYRALQPLAGPEGRVAPSYVWFWAVSAEATPEEQEAAWEFLSWISAADQYASVYENVGLIPITNDIPEQFAEDEWVQAFNEGLEYAQIYYEDILKWEQIDVALGEELERFAVGEITAEEFLSNAEKRVNEILASS